MKSFKTFMIEQEQLQEGIVKKGVVAAYAFQGRKHGNNAVRSYNRAKQALRQVTNAKRPDAKVDVLVLALIDLLDGLVAQRRQIGSVSSQTAAIALLQRQRR